MKAASRGTRDPHFIQQPGVGRVESRIVSEHDGSRPRRYRERANRRLADFDAVDEQQGAAGIAIEHPGDVVEGAVAEIPAGGNDYQVSGGVAERPAQVVRNIAVAIETEGPARFVCIRLALAQSRGARGGDCAWIVVES